MAFFFGSSDGARDVARAAGSSCAQLGGGCCTKVRRPARNGEHKMTGTKKPRQAGLSGALTAVWKTHGNCTFGGKGVCLRAFLARPKKSKKKNSSNENCKNVVLGCPIKAHRQPDFKMTSPSAYFCFAPRATTASEHFQPGSSTSKRYRAACCPHCRWSCVCGGS